MEAFVWNWKEWQRKGGWEFVCFEKWSQEDDFVRWMTY